MISILVQDDGFQPWSQSALPKAPLFLDATAMPEEVDLKAVQDDHDNMIIIDFANFSDGRGFSIAHNLRLQGFDGQLLAKGHVISDQYRHVRQSGFDGVLLTEEQAKRMPEAYWQEQATRVNISYRDRIYG